MEKRVLFRYLVLALIFISLIASLIFLRYGKLVGFVIFESSISEINDSYIYEGSKNTNYGTSTIIEADSEGNQKSERILIFFDISSILSNSTINNATLQLYLTSGTGSNFYLRLYRLTRQWVENSVTWDTYDGTNLWTTDGGDYDSQVYAETLINSTVEWKSWDITNLVREFINGTYTNYGFILIPEQQTGNNYKQFASSENADTTKIPKLTIDYVSDTSPPNLQIVFPVNGVTYNYNQSINLNYTVSDSNLQACWYHIDSNANITLICGQNRTFDTSEGSHTIYLYANDSFGNQNRSSVTFNIDLNTAPTLNLILPQEGATYGYNTSINLNFSVSDADNNLASCWYNIDSGQNITISGCQNTSFNASEGSHILNIYANDSYGLEINDSASFNIQLGAPTIILSSPIDVYLASGDVEFRYTPSDIDLDSCELWGNFTGVFALNQTNTNPNNGVENIFSLTLNDRSYLWNIRCNDSVGNSVFNGNKSFVVDTIKPEITISQPSGTKTTRSIQASWTVSDANLEQCWYNVYRGANLEIANTSVNCSLDTMTFSVTLDADFIFNFYANDSSGNINFSSSAFTVDTSQQPSGETGGDGGGDGGSTTGGVPVIKGKIEISDIGDVIVNPGESKTLVASVKNTGKIFLNKCKLIGIGENANLISSKDVKGLAIGQKEDFVFVLNIPGDFKDSILEIVVKCEEVQENKKFNAILSKNIIEVELVSIEQKGKKLNFVYLVREKLGKNQEINANFWIENSDARKITEGKDSFNLNANDELRKEGSLDLTGNAGEYIFNLELTSGEYKTSLREPVLIGEAIGLLGRAILVAGGGKILIIGILVVLALFLIVLFIRKKLMKKTEEKEGYIKVKAGR